MAYLKRCHSTWRIQVHLVKRKKNGIFLTLWNWLHTSKKLVCDAIAEVFTYFETQICRIQQFAVCQPWGIEAKSPWKEKHFHHPPYNGQKTGPEPWSNGGTTTKPADLDRHLIGPTGKRLVSVPLTKTKIYKEFKDIYINNHICCPISPMGWASEVFRASKKQ